MIKLLKYDWKRNANAFLGGAVVLAVLQTLITYFGLVKGWDEIMIIVLSVILYATAGIFLIVLGAKTFDHNIKAYHRRLLPVHPVWTICSALFICVLSTLLLTVMMGIHGVIFIQFLSIPDLQQFFNELAFKEVMIIAFQGFWEYSLFILMLFLAISVGSAISIRGKVKVWIAIGFFFLLANVFDFIGTKVFKSAELIQFELSQEAMSNGLQHFHWGLFAFEIGLAVVMVWGMSYLLNRKMEI